MMILLAILSGVLWVASIAAAYGRPTIAPSLSFLGLLALSFVRVNNMLFVNNTILTGWLCMTLVVTFATMLQPESVKRQTKGMAYMIGGGLAGLAVGLLGRSFDTAITLQYTCMILGVTVGVTLGFLLYSRTPSGMPVRPGSGNFFRFLLAKGFPTAITLMMLGVALVILINIYN